MSYTGKRGRKALTESQARGRAGSAVGKWAGRGRPATEKPLPKGLKVDTVLPVPPESMHESAKREWERVGRYLELTDRVSKLDMQAMMVYCTSYNVFGRSLRPMLVDRQPLWSHVKGKPSPNVLAGLTAQHGKIMFETALRFGMTARTRHLDFVTGAGRPALPSQIHELRGSGSLRAKRKPLPKTWDDDAVEMPSWLNDKRSAAEWNRMVGVLDNLELWTPLDVGVIAVSIGCYSLMAKCAEMLDRQGLAVANLKGGANEHPASSIYRTHYHLLNIIWKEYGMTPHDRMQFEPAQGEQQGKVKLTVYPEEAAG